MNATVPSRPPQNLRVQPMAVLAYSMGRAMAGVVVMLSVPIWMHAFAPSAYGTYSVVFTSGLIGASLGTGWVRQAALRFTGRDGQALLDHPRAVLVLAVLTVEGFTTAATAMVLGGGAGIPGTTWLAIQGYALSFGIYSLTQVASQRDGHAIRFNAAEIVRACGTLAVSLLLRRMLSADGALCMILGGVVGNVMSIAITAQASRQILRPAGQRAWSVARLSWDFGWPMSVWLGISSLTLYSDRFVLAPHVARDQLGTYTATADLIVRGFAMLALPILLAVHPVLMREYNQHGGETAQRSLRRWSIFLGSTITVAVILVAALGKPIIQMLIGRSTLSEPSIIVLAIGAGVWQYVLIAHKTLEFHNRTRSMMSYIVLSLVVELALAMALVTEFGVLGVVTAFLAGGLVYLGMVRAATRKLRGQRMTPTMSLSGLADLSFRGLYPFVAAPYYAVANMLRRRPVTGDADAVVCLTTFGSRTRLSHLAIESIASGSSRPKRLILWVEDQELAQHPNAALKRLQGRGLEIKYTPDYGPHKKYFPYVCSSRRHYLPLVTADDDVAYPRGWLRGLLEAAAENPADVLCYRAHRMRLTECTIEPYVSWEPCLTTRPSTLHMATGTSGILYPPSMLDLLRTRGDDFMRWARDTDDVWLHWVALRAGVKVRQLSARPRHFPQFLRTQRAALNIRNRQTGNDDAVALLYDQADLARLQEEQERACQGPTANYSPAFGSQP